MATKVALNQRASIHGILPYLWTYFCDKAFANHTTYAVIVNPPPLQMSKEFSRVIGVLDTLSSIGDFDTNFSYFIKGGHVLWVI